MINVFLKSRQKLLIVAIGLSLFLIPGSSYFSLAQNEPRTDKPLQLFLPAMPNSQSGNPSGNLSNSQAEQSPPQNLSQNDHNHHISHRFDRFTGYGETWPPQPKNIEEVVWFDQDESAVAAASAQVAQAVELAENNVALRSLLGQRFTHIGTAFDSNKGQKAVQETVTYFSHSANATIDVQVKNGTVVEIQEIAPTVYQPPLTDDEVNEAVEIARTYWRTGGYARVDELEGFGILGLTSTGVTGFHALRVVYVSFHINADMPPDYVGYVDLTNQTVLESWEE